MTKPRRVILRHAYVVLRHAYVILRQPLQTAKNDHVMQKV